jgi:hypothetical protein
LLDQKVTAKFPTLEKGSNVQRQLFRPASPEWVKAFEAGDIVTLRRLDPPTNRTLRAGVWHAIEGRKGS